MVEPGIYQHYKGGKYLVTGHALFESTQEPMVIYEALYDNPVSKVWVRPEKEFTQNIEVDGQTVRRYKFIGEHGT